MTYNSTNYVIDQYKIETHTEMVNWGSTVADRNETRGFQTTNNGVNVINQKYSINTHSYLDSIYFDEGDYEIYLTYIWRHINIGGSIVSYYGSNSSSPRLTIGKAPDAELISSGTPLANGTFTQIGSHLYHEQSIDSTYVLRIELGMQFRVEGNPIVPKFTNYNWSSYSLYSAGAQYDIQIKKYKLNSL